MLIVCGYTVRSKSLQQLCPIEMPYWAKNYVTIFMRGAH